MKVTTFFKLFLFIAILLFSGCSNNDASKIETAIRKQLEKYPESRLQDIYKNFYQDCFGTGHAISDTAMVLNYLLNEIENTTSTSSTVRIDTLGWRHHFVRIPIDMVRQGKISAEDLTKVFVVSASKINPKDTANWKNEWQIISRIIEEKNLPVKNFKEDKLLIDSVLKTNPNAAMHHSAAYNEQYNPHYRVVEKTVFEKLR